ncbi:MAG: hypothetical protein E5W25_31635, partial [Mesorhizobium sp.]
MVGNSLNRRRMFGNGQSDVVISGRVVVERQFILERQGNSIIEIVLERGFDRRRCNLCGTMVDCLDGMI